MSWTQDSRGTHVIPHHELNPALYSKYSLSQKVSGNSSIVIAIGELLLLPTTWRCVLGDMAAFHSLSGTRTIGLCSTNREIPLHMILPRMPKSVSRSGGAMYRQGLVVSERSPRDVPNNLISRDLGSKWGETGQYVQPVNPAWSSNRVLSCLATKFAIYHHILAQKSLRRQ
jgi:hypothetical protein